MTESFTIDLSQIMTILEEINNIARTETQQARATADISDKIDRPMPLRKTAINGRIKRPMPARASLASTFEETRQ